MSSSEKYVAVSMSRTSELLEKIEKAVAIIATFRISKKLTTLDFDAEVARVERCVEHQYANTRVQQDFNEFALDFIQSNASDLVYSEQYSGMYLDDVPNVYYKDSLEDIEEV